MESFSTPESLQLLPGFALEALTEAACLGLPCSINTFQHGPQLHRIIYGGVWSPMPFPTLFSKSKWSHLCHIFQKEEVLCPFVVELSWPVLLAKPGSSS